ncbi:MgtC/SapB family protein [Larkinella soli]|uniref:MgtC/SapB family protein n=1 Tax=Larkinella soli TaxID=1770527 RepID=UPI000FFB3499|nr:MgtC/SapB family protein [Larkinella soli]
MEFVEKEEVIKLFLAMLLGGLVGAEREYRSKSAGLRTTILICVGSAAFTMVSVRLGDDRIAANIVNGIGFLGAGIIYRQEASVKGLTTAATIWAVAALGMAIGGGYYDIAIICFAAIFATLLLLTGISHRIGRINQTRQYRIVTQFKNKTLNHYEKQFEDCGLVAQRDSQQRIGTDIIGKWKVTGPEKAHEKCIKRLLNDSEVKEVEF